MVIIKAKFEFQVEIKHATWQTLVKVRSSWDKNKYKFSMTVLEIKTLSNTILLNITFPTQDVPEAIPPYTLPWVELPTIES